MKKLKGIRKRWIVNSLSSALLIVLLAVATFSVSMVSYYYKSMSNKLQEKASSAVSFFSSYKTEEAFYQNAYTYINYQFQEKDRLDFQLVDTDGTVRFSSFFESSGYTPGTPDIDFALGSNETEEPGMKVWTGSDPNTGEHIMAVSCPLLVDGEVACVIRLVTSLNRVDRQIMFIIVGALLVGLVIVAMIYVSNLYFLRSIVDPVTEVTATADSVASAVKLFENPDFCPDLILSDIVLADGLSFTVFDKVKADIPVIFVTAHDEYAVRAFKYDGLAYILKPVTADTLRSALYKLRRLSVLSVMPVIEPLISGISEGSRTWLEHILVEGFNEYFPADVSHVCLFEVEQKSTKVYLDDGRTGFVDITLKELESRLNPAEFVRISRQCLIRLDKVRSFIRLNDEEYEVSFFPPQNRTVVLSGVKFREIRHMF